MSGPYVRTEPGVALAMSGRRGYRALCTTPAAACPGARAGPLGPRLPDGTGSLMSHSDRQAGPPSRAVDWPALVGLRRQWRAAGKVVVWTNGCFDLLHVGHLRSLRA